VLLFRDRKLKKKKLEASPEMTVYETDYRSSSSVNRVGKEEIARLNEGEGGEGITRAKNESVGEKRSEKQESALFHSYLPSSLTSLESRERERSGLIGGVQEPPCAC